MKDALLRQVRDFLHAHYQPGKPLLLGFSGGTDSLALFHLLLEYKKKFPLDLHLAHIDHGWRKESYEQALMLQEQAHELKIPFHLQRLNSQIFEKGNPENTARQERQKFFLATYKKIGAGALLLAHQKEDLAETVLKRVLEGAHVLSFSSMQPVSFFGEMVVWRPLLSCSKNSLTEWLEEQGLKPIEDETNDDTKFLRARMRKDIFPHLEALFGKKVTDGLCLLAEQAGDLKHHFEKKFLVYEAVAEQGALGCFLDFKLLPSLDAFELPSFLKFFFNRKGLIIPKEMLTQISSFIVAGSFNKKFYLQEKEIFVEGRILFICENPLCSFPFQGPLKPESYTHKEWTWDICWDKAEEFASPTSWKEAFLQGRVHVVLTDGDYELAGSHSEEKKLQKENLRGKWAKKEVPVFLRHFFPFVLKDHKLIHEFLTGHTRPQTSTHALKRLSIRVKRNDKYKDNNRDPLLR